ncbi:MAG: tRNA (adenosine(37)-N6)-threonylcarbamoyltransferase complex transferase subunit TsaD [Patescibacteria group bacterium]
MKSQKNKNIYTLAIDTSCDDTAVAILKNDRVLANIVSSQIDIHKEWGGVVPNLAKREHQKMIDGCIALALKRSGLKGISKIDVFAVTHGPGLAPALEVGVAKVKELALENDRPLIAVNHMEGHALSVFLKNKFGKYYSGLKRYSEKHDFPFLALCISGGHTEIVLVEDFGKYKIIGQTLDDAAGEAFDKIARMLGLGYPGGAVISKFAEGKNKNTYALPRPMQHSKDLDFSFSGLKTACLYQTNDLKKQLSEKDFAKIIPDYCASVQEAIIDSLIGKTIKAVKKIQPKMLVTGGGVIANKPLRARLRKEMKSLKIPVYFPASQFCQDNAAMIGLVAYMKYLRKETVEDIPALQRKPSITIEA